MTSKMRILLADLAHDYTPNHFCAPLGVGFIGEHLRQKYPDSVDIRLFKSPGKLLSAIRETRPHIVGLSNYSWNQELNRLIEKRVAAEFPDTILIQGGPHIRISQEGIEQHLRDHPEVDYYMMFEGEFPTAELVGHMLSKGRLVKPRNLDITIKGIAHLAGGGERLHYEARASQKGELAGIPSPYLTGMLDEFLDSAEYLPLLETNRGCPFACTFCAWGISAMDKVRRFDLERIVSEIEYVGDRSQASHWYFTDANFGMFERDVEIAHALRRAADKSRYLRRISINWAKNSSKYCTEIAHVLKGICDPLVAVQSTDPKVLKHIKRDNIRMSTITDLVAQSRKDKIAMTTDVLAGLPEETLTSHFNTLRDVFSIGFESFNVGQIRMLPGSEMETPEQRELYNLHTRFRLIPGSFGVYDGEAITEYEESIVETNTMSRDDMFVLRITHFLAWALWNSGLAQPLLRYMFKVEKINPLDAILQLIKGTIAGRAGELLSDYTAEAKTEWFDSAEELMTYFKTNQKTLSQDQRLKLNLKYLGRLLLDRDLAREVMLTLASESKSPVVAELVEFSLERLFFINDRRSEKKVQYSRELVHALAEVYPNVRADGPVECRFSVDEKYVRVIGMELQRFSFDDNPLRAVALTLQNYGDKMMYDFAFGDVVENTGRDVFTDSFDYADQLKARRAS